MTRMLIIGLVWLSMSAFVGVLIGFAIHRADLRDDQFPPAPPTLGDDRGVTALPTSSRGSHVVRRRRPTPAFPPVDGGPPGRSRPG